MTTQSLDKNLGITTMEAALAKMTDIIKTKGGELAVKMKVHLSYVYSHF